MMLHESPDRYESADKASIHRDAPISNADSASQNKTGNQIENKIGNQIRNQTRNQINEKSRQPYLSVCVRWVFSCPTWHAFKT